MIVSPRVFLEIRNVADRRCRENEDTHFMLRKNTHPKVLYLLHASDGQWITICLLSYFWSLHSRQSSHCGSPSLNISALSVVWTVNSPTATLSFNLLIAWSTFALLHRGSLISVLDWFQPSQTFHLFRCFCLKWVLMAYLPTTRQNM